jgi:cytochrome P450
MSSMFAKVTAALGFPIPIELPFTPYGQGMAARREIVKRLTKEIAKYRTAAAAVVAVAGGQQGAAVAAEAGGQQGAAPAARRPALVERWLSARDESGQGLTEDQLADNLIGLLVAGHDTTSSTLSIVLYYLSK